MGIVESEFTGPTVREWEKMEREKKDRGGRQIGQEIVNEPDDPGEEDDGLGEAKPVEVGR